MKKSDIFVYFGGGTRTPKGDAWRITSKKSDFYIEPRGVGRFLHLSVHGPKQGYSTTQFHIRFDAAAEQRLRKRGHRVETNLSATKPFIFSGQRVSRHAFLVARIRWTWEWQLPQHAGAVVPQQGVPPLNAGSRGAILSKPMPLGNAADVDIFISEKQPYWPDEAQTFRKVVTSRTLMDESRLGPLTNDSGLHLSAVSYARPQGEYPIPPGLAQPPVRAGAKPSAMLAAGPGEKGASDFYWFVNCLTTSPLAT